MSVSVRDLGDGTLATSIGSFEFLTGGADDPAAQTNSSDLLLAALATCAAGTIRAFALSAPIPEFEGVEVRASAVAASRPQRLAEINLEIALHGPLVERQVEQLKRAASRCKIHNTLHGEPAVAMSFTTAGD